MVYLKQKGDLKYTYFKKLLIVSLAIQLSSSLSISLLAFAYFVLKYY